MSKPKICIVGPGVVGQATGKVFAAKGFNTAFLGRTREKVDKLVSLGYKAYTKEELINGSYDFDITILTVPTPTVNGKIDLSAINETSIDLGKKIKSMNKYHLAVVKSTVPPGTTEDLVLKNLERYSGKKAGKDFGLCMNPEYLREEFAFDDTLNAWIITIGQYDNKSGDMLESVYKTFNSPIFRIKIKEAEMQKYVHNLFNAAKISFFNEMREIANTLGIDADKIFSLTAISAEGMWNPRYGTRDIGPYQGSCLPKDTKAFFEWAQKDKHDVSLLEAVMKVNDSLLTKLELTQTKPSNHVQGKNNKKAHDKEQIIGKKILGASL